MSITIILTAYLPFRIPHFLYCAFLITQKITMSNFITIEFSIKAKFNTQFIISFAF